MMRAPIGKPQKSPRKGRKNLLEKGRKQPSKRILRSQEAVAMHRMQAEERSGSETEEAMEELCETRD